MVHLHKEHLVFARHCSKPLIFSGNMTDIIYIMPQETYSLMEETELNIYSPNSEKFMKEKKRLLSENFSVNVTFKLKPAR